MALYQRVARLTPTGAEEIKPVSTPGVPLGAGLFVTPRDFTYNLTAGPGVYPLREQGVHALLAADGAYADGGFRVVTRPDGKMDVMPFMEAMASLCAYGTIDEPYSIADKLTAAKTRLLEMRCGPTMALVIACARSVGIEIREVRAVALTEQNGFDDGHVLCEAKIGGRWRLFDVPNDIAWSLDGELASFADVVERFDDAEMVALAPHRVGRSVPAWLAALYESTFRSDADLRKWCARIYQAPGIVDASGVVTFGLRDLGLSSKITAFGWRVMPFADWRAAFYP